MAANRGAVERRDVLDEAREMLEEPSRNAKRKILFSLNMVLGPLILLHTIVQLATTGHLPDPGRDNIIMPALIVMNLGSALYTGVMMARQVEGSRLWNGVTRWGTILLFQTLCIAIVHSNPNTATSLLLDQSLSTVTIFLTGVILGRRAAVVWFVVSLVSLAVAVRARGVDFEYILMTRSEVARLYALRDADPAAFAARAAEAAREGLVPLPLVLFASVSILFALFAFLPTYFEVGILGGVLRAIPAAIEKLQIAARERRELKQENVRMAMELDVARHIQAMVLPREEELARCAGLDVAARMKPANEVGGDIYDVLPRPDGSTVIAIGDVTDHGLASGVVMLMCQSALRTCIEGAELDLLASLSRVNSVLYKNVQGRMKDPRTMSLSLVYHKEGRVRIAGQHETVLVLREGSSEVTSINTMDLGFSIGLLEDVSPMLAEASLDLGPGDRLLLYTDGATDAEDAAGELFGVERLKSALLRARDLETTGELLDRLLSDIGEWIGTAKVHDDIALVLIRRTG